MILKFQILLKQTLKILNKIVFKWLQIFTNLSQNTVTYLFILNVLRFHKTNLKLLKMFLIFI